MAPTANPTAYPTAYPTAQLTESPTGNLTTGSPTSNLSPTSTQDVPTATVGSATTVTANSDASTLARPTSAPSRDPLPQLTTRSSTLVLSPTIPPEGLLTTTVEPTVTVAVATEPASTTSFEAPTTVTEARGTTGVITTAAAGDVVVDRAEDSKQSQGSSTELIAVMAGGIVVASIACMVLVGIRARRKHGVERAAPLQRAITLRKATLMMVENPLFPSASSTAHPSRKPRWKSRRSRSAAQIPEADVDVDAQTPEVDAQIPVADAEYVEPRHDNNAGYLMVQHEYSAIDEDGDGDQEYASVDDNVAIAKRDSIVSATSSHYEYSSVENMQRSHAQPSEQAQEGRRSAAPTIYMDPDSDLDSGPTESTDVAKDEARPAPEAPADYAEAGNVTDPSMAAADVVEAGDENTYDTPLQWSLPRGAALGADNLLASDHAPESAMPSSADANQDAPVPPDRIGNKVLNDAAQPEYLTPIAPATALPDEVAYETPVPLPSAREREDRSSRKLALRLGSVHGHRGSRPIPSEDQYEEPVAAMYEEPVPAMYAEPVPVAETSDDMGCQTPSAAPNSQQPTSVEPDYATPMLASMVPRGPTYNEAPTGPGTEAEDPTYATVSDSVYDIAPVAAANATYDVAPTRAKPVVTRLPANVEQWVQDPAPTQVDAESDLSEALLGQGSYCFRLGSRGGLVRGSSHHYAS